MNTSNYSNNNSLPITEQDSLIPTSIRDAFLSWLLEGNARKYSPQEAIACVNKVSEYVISKKISCSIWEITSKSVYSPVYKKILDTKLFKITEKRTYKVFIVVGQLYAKFLKDKPWESIIEVTKSIPAHGVAELANHSLVPTEIAALEIKNENLSTETETLSPKKVNFDQKESSYAKTRPTACVINGQSVTPNIWNWSQLLVTIVEYFIADNNQNLESLNRIPLYGKKAFLLTHKAEFGTCAKLSNGKWIYTNYNAQTVVRIIENLCLHCGLDLSDVVISCEAMDSNTNVKIIAGCEPKADEAINLVRPNKTITIKEAVSKVLSEESKPMTADAIYDKIINKSLYSFGAQNPINVIRTTIEYACDNSSYTNKNVVPTFHFERNSDGKRVYSLLLERRMEAATEQVTAADELSPKQRHDVVIWNSTLEQKFQRWLESEKYAPRTVRVYLLAAAQVFRDYPTLAERAVVSSKTELEAISEFVVLLNNDDDYVKVNTSRHNQFSAALAALERFFSADTVNAEDNSDVLIRKQPTLPSVPSSSLDSIVDLAEGKTRVSEILEAHFQALYGYSNLSILWNAAQDNLSLFLNDNAINTADDFWRLIYRAFIGEYVMSNPHIWKKQPNYPQSYVGVIINLARNLGGIVSREKIDEYFSRIKQRSLINRQLIREGMLLFYAPKQFILEESVNLSNDRCQAIRKSLYRIFERERVPYIVLRDIAEEWFSSLPTITGNLKWTALLLQEVLRLRPTIGYRIVFSGLERQDLDTLGAAIVPNTSEINSFADVAHRYCYEKEYLEKRMFAEDLRIILRGAGMLEGNELIYNLHKALRDYRFAFTDENKMVKILER